ncbi:hypothetical protein Cgig2_017947 [Carnegiea gigantea]|uniref:Uncharacterized protein n=1 Tax=Carnegiea gigantea TaxID=171969 RepID=A0A9Q1KB23_9CARY|nr:hypothetical protein Cgig2_017947 [Carnegiea gigantea]
MRDVILTCRDWRYDSKNKSLGLRPLEMANRNTRFFHTRTVIRHKFNRNKALQNDEGEWIADSDQIYNRKIHRFLWGGDVHGKKDSFGPTSLRPLRLGGRGIPVMRELNGAWLMKLGWRMVLEPEKHINIVEVGTFLITTRPPKPHHLNAWRGIVVQRHQVEEHAGMALGDRRATRLWLDR